MQRVYNFSAGPSALPEEVLKKAQSEMLCYGTSGMSVMEMSHRSKDFMSILDSAENNLRELMQVPDNYKILFLQGGASSQFGMVPLNLMNKNNKADYVNTGTWATKAIKEAKRYGKVNVVASSEDTTFNYIPKLDAATFDKEADYFHITTNNTIYGTRFHELPDTGEVPLIGDMSSDILSKKYDVSKFGLIYAGAQKNLGAAGVTVVIIREDLAGNQMDITPTMFNYKLFIDNGSMYNTPPTFGIYMCGLVFQWLKDMGGVEVIEKINIEKANTLYNYLDESTFFSSTVQGNDRSVMNIPFVTGNEELDSKFIKEATAAGFVQLKGHRSVGGMRASIYNAIQLEGVQKLVDFMKNFETNNS
ncbi:MAG TPA: 3-phosphoserine/phosphohydroxythreonine transaminase [Niabella sp.]|nr:3-phosphoserine/phosphohydroxythreonine transaminase [Niabella sp.]HQW14966.1 3-phosphoserine/phosphohydroxythreonine transaminase [Niabella sp.]HQX20142.1 3-phosphoserine/phosphohydroxythreonine transaminase [Niabella sp.]HRB06747.1 3-phosphoserine/phosphohydroxythreonine transaminase [Niabella sp.]HRB27584.1 3-phosphoserine/phosphohydroxythreonine transaminase [Niabella sp.]